MPTFRPLRINGMNLDPGPRVVGGNPEFFDPHLRLWTINGLPASDVDSVRYSDLDLVKMAGYDTVRWGLLPGDIWGDGWDVVGTRLRPVLDEANRLGLRVIYPVWWNTDEEAFDTLGYDLPILAEYPNVIPQFGDNEWMDPNGKSRSTWDVVKDQVDEMAEMWRVIAPGRPWIAPQVCPNQRTGDLSIDWVSLKLHADAWPDAYLGVGLYGEDGVRPGLTGVRADVVDIADLTRQYGNRIVVTEHGRSRDTLRADWRSHAYWRAKGDQFVNAAPFPNFSGLQYKWRHFGQPTDKHARFSVMPVQVVGVEA